MDDFFFVCLYIPDGTLMYLVRHCIFFLGEGERVVWVNFASSGKAIDRHPVSAKLIGAGLAFFDAFARAFIAWIVRKIVYAFGSKT